ncbi:MAG: class I SAM-dependent methyltransferase [Opitutaceae bacterium]|jgi:cyclopropane-fatty-acyl-phospholipid synthase|nr:class I SAM-dependent methyltransferase [Opitutaceae bacterium]
MNSRSATLTSTENTTSGAHASLSRRLLVDALTGMDRGSLIIELPEGGQLLFGDPAPQADLNMGISPHAAIRVRRESFFKKCVLAGDIGFGESFVDGDWESSDLTAVIGWFINNVENAPTLSGSKRKRWKDRAVNLLRIANRFGHLLRPNNRTTARRNISEHYDLSNEFFALFLDQNMMYSGAHFAAVDTPLIEAQAAKNEALCQKLQLQTGDHVLEIGTGWGGWAIHAVKNHDCKVTTVTISKEQRDLAVQRIADAGLSDRIDVQLRDFRDITGSYDKIVSIEMMEALGHRYQTAFAEAIARLLKPSGRVALQFITCPDGRYEEFRKGVDFIQKHIFPGSLLLSTNRINQLLAQSGNFVLRGLEDHGLDYTITLRHWQSAFSRRLDDVRALGFDDRFIRKWEYYLHYCEAAFGLRNISVVQTVHTRANFLAG